MKKPTRFLRLVLATGLLISALAATVGPAAAQQNAPDGPTMDHIFQTTAPAFSFGDNAIFYPWVANGDDFGLGDSVTSISVQNLQDVDGQIWIYRGDGNNGWTLATTAALSAYASKTFTAAQLGIAEGDGAPVAVRGYEWIPAVTLPDLPVGGFAAETEVTLVNPVAENEAGGEFTQVWLCVANAYNAAGTIGNPYPFTLAIDQLVWDGEVYEMGDPVPWANQAELQAILDFVNENNAGQMINPFGGLNQDGDCFDVGINFTTAGFLNSLTIGGTALQTATEAAPDTGNGNGDDDGAELEQLVTTHTSVSGYNALNGVEVYKFDEWYLPIVQTNCGPGGCWDSMLRIANVANLNSAVTVRFFPASDGSGSLQTSFQLQALVNGGDTWHINLGDYVPDGWVGAAHIYSDGQIFAMVDRYKVGYNMWVTNTGSSADYENVAQLTSTGGKYVLFAPSVMMDYYGWNTGINVANLYDGDNNVSVQYFNMMGNATQVANQRLAAHGMFYFYDPSVGAQNNSAQDVATDPNANVVGSALIWSDHPVAAAIDATKYPETDPRGGVDLFQATSYNATQNVYTWQAVPYVTKGNPVDGSGATSGINIMNPNPTAATAHVFWVNPSGFNAQNTGIGSVTIPGFANGFLYTLWQHNLPNGFMGAAQVIANVPVAAVSANVNYDVDGDGSAMFNAFNPCGLYRTVGDCTFGDPFDVTGGSVTKYFVDEWGDPVPGVVMMIEGDNPAFPYTRQGVSNVDGQVTFTNVPVGNYDLNVLQVPMVEGDDDELVPLYVIPENPADSFTLLEGEDWVETNTLIANQGFEKTVCAVGDFFRVVSGLQGTTGLFECSEFILAGVNVTVYENIGEDPFGAPVAGAVMFDGITGADGTAGGTLPVGNYILCIWDADGEAITSNGETVVPALADTGAYGALDAYCEPFPVVAGQVTFLENPVRLLQGEINMLVWSDGEFPDFPNGEFPNGLIGGSYSLQDHEANQPPIAGIRVCIEHEYDEYDGCATTGADGTVNFPDAPEGFYYAWVEDVGDNDLMFWCATGGEHTAFPIYPDCDGGIVGPPGPTGPFSSDLQGGNGPLPRECDRVERVNHEIQGPVNGFIGADFCFYYSPSADLGQDGWLSDINRGTYDVEVYMVPDAGLGIIDGFVGTDFNSTSYSLQSHLGDLSPYASTYVCIQGLGFDYDECDTSDSSGHVQFLNAPTGEYIGTVQPVQAYNLRCIEGGVLNVQVVFPECGGLEPASHQLEGLPYGNFSFFYSSYLDIEQDTVLDDIADIGGDGTFDVIFEMWTVQPPE